MSDEDNINKKEENQPENQEEEHHKKKKKKKKKKHKENTEENTQENEKDNNNIINDIDIKTNNSTEDEKELNKEALSNIPSKEVPKKKKKKKKKGQNDTKEEINESKEEKETKEEKEEKKTKEEKEEKEEKKEKEEKEEKKEKREKKRKKTKKEKKEEKENKEKEMDIDDLLNKNNENDGGLMITELLGIDGEKKKKKEKDETENELIKEVLPEEKALDTKSGYLKDKFDSLQVSESLRTGINNGIQKSHEDIHEDIKSNRLIINNKVTSTSDLLNKSLESIMNSRVFLTDVEKYMTKQNIKYLKNLKNEEQILKKNIEKLSLNQKVIEDSAPLKTNVVDINIRQSQLKDLSKTKDGLISRLEKINQKIELLLEDEKLRQKAYRPYMTEIGGDDDDNTQKFNLQLTKMQKKEEIIRKKYQKDLEKAINKKNQEYDEKEKNLNELKLKLFIEAKQREKDIFLKRKNEIDEKMEKTKKYINERFTKKEKDYLFFRYKDNFEKKEKKLIDKINMTKKDPLVTQEELKELAEKIEQQKQYLMENAEEKRKQMQKLWSYRSQTLPNYRHPLQVKIEEEQMKKQNDEENERKKKEANLLDKINYRPPNVKIDNNLKQIREKRINQNNREMVLETELNNKKRLNIFKIDPKTIKNNKSLKDEKSAILNHNNFIDLNEIKKSFVQKKKNKLKPIRILHPKPIKPIDYLQEMRDKRNISPELEKQKTANFDDLFKGDMKNENIFESLEVAKIRTNNIDKKVERKKEIMNTNGGYLKNPYLAGEIGDLLVESIQAKLKIMNKLNGGE